MSNTKPTAVEKFQKQLATRQDRLVKQIAKAVKIAEKAGSTFDEQEALYDNGDYRSMAPSLKGSEKNDYLDSYSIFCDIRNTIGDIERTESDLAYAIEAQAKKEAKAAAKAAADLGVRMTCQCCARDIQSNTGTVAHHGYERPGYGYQTASCMGAKHLPIEADYSVLVRFIAMLKNSLTDMETRRANVANETLPVKFSYNIYIKRPNSCYSDPKEVNATVTRETFEACKVEHAEYFRGRYSVTFDSMKADALRSQDRKIEDQKEYISFQEGRLEAAIKAGVTHKFNTNIDRWEAI